MRDKGILNDVVAYNDFRKRVMGYAYSGKQLWADIQRKKEIRGAVTWNDDDGTIHDRQYPHLLTHWLAERRNIKTHHS